MWTCTSPGMHTSTSRSRRKRCMCPCLAFSERKRHEEIALGDATTKIMCEPELSFQLLIFHSFFHFRSAASVAREAPAQAHSISLHGHWPATFSGTRKRSAAEASSCLLVCRRCGCRLIWRKNNDREAGWHARAFQDHEDKRMGQLVIASMHAQHPHLYDAALVTALERVCLTLCLVIARAGAFGRASLLLQRVLLE